MKIELKQIEVKNFKGIKSLKEALNPITNIEGANRSGKTRVVDAFLWCLFGKDSRDRTDFVVKPLDKDNNVIHKVDISVFLLFDIDGTELKIKRTLRENWVKPRGQKDLILKGNNTFYEWSDMDVSSGEFDKRRDELIHESYFKLLTNPLYFNSLPWKIRRQMVTSLVTEKISLPDSEFNKLSDKDLEEKRRFLASQIKKIKKELDLIPVRIDEAHTNKPPELNWKMMQAESQSKTRSLEIVEAQIIDKSKVLTAFNESRLTEQNELAKFKSDLELYVTDFNLKSNIDRTELESKIQENSRELQKCNTYIKASKADIEGGNNGLKYLNEQRELKLKEWHEWHDKEFKEEACSVCGQELPGEDVDDMRIAFAFNQSNNLQRICIEGMDIAKSIGELTQKIKNSEIEIKAEEEESTKLLKIQTKYILELEKIKVPDIKKDEGYIILFDIWMDKKTELEKIKPPAVDTDILKAKKQSLQSDIDQLKIGLNVRTQIAEIDSRIQDLKTQEKTKANILVDLENQEFEIEEYVKIKMTAIEKAVNSKFKLAQFKMFEKQLNEGEKETCVTLFNGIPYNSNLNSEARINVGLDIINTFSKHYNIVAPIFIDNRESTSEIIKTDAQIINLIVNPECKTLKIS